ncbi:MAG: TRAP transporter substrate-binding protein [Rhizobiaceae bacterium]|nr:TRAP transporter substrate-binding protein [Rhizobiaceae bacterium]
MTFDISRRGLLVAGSALAVLPFSSRFGHAAEVTLRLGHSAPVEHPFHIRVAEAAEAIAKETDGKVELQIFPASALGGDNDLMSQTRSGGLDFCQPTGQILSSILPVAATPALGFVFSDYDAVWAALDGDLGAHIRKEIEANTGLVPMEKIWDLGFKLLWTGSKQVRTPEDLVGLKVRVPVSPVSVSLYKALQANPVTIQFSDVYTALQTKMADGMDLQASYFYISHFYEVQRYCALTNHSWDGQWLCANKAMWEGLTPEIRDVIAKNLNNAAVLQREDLVKVSSTVVEDLKTKGIEFNEADTAAFKRKLKEVGYYDEWRKELGADAIGLLEKYSGPLGG